MAPSKSTLLDRVKQYHFELKHLMVIFVVLVFFLILISFVYKTSLQELLVNTQDWYQQDSAERMANLTSTSLELLLETVAESEVLTTEEVHQTVQAFNIILSQQKLQQHVSEVCLLVEHEGQIIAIDDGSKLYEYFFGDRNKLLPPDSSHRKAVGFYRDSLKTHLMESEQIYSIREGEQTFHVFVPFVPKGEFVGAVYIRNVPDFSFITRKIITSYDEIALIFASLITLGLLAMFYISSYTVKERDETRQLLYQERERHLLEKIDRQKEELFTKRIYHTHHKAEKVMGFIKEDLRNLTPENIGEIRFRLTRYANFISRVIYDMKWYDPPIQTIRNPLFRTDLNEVIRFIVNNIFLRTTTGIQYQFELQLDENLPPVSINEFVVWEVLEPLIQNCVEHSGNEKITITITSRYCPEEGLSRIIIADNGKGFDPALLETNEQGIKRLFLENISTKESRQNSGYGCYLAYEISTRRCRWQLDAENLPGGGCRYIITIPNNASA
ncbi:MAG: histidine kinase [Calditrichaeota bacterium]|nr:MAG: histidine kinase [Calditrichota bacterium]